MPLESAVEGVSVRRQGAKPDRDREREREFKTKHGLGVLPNNGIDSVLLFSNCVAGPRTKYCIHTCLFKMLAWKWAPDNIPQYITTPYNTVVWILCSRRSGPRSLMMKSQNGWKLVHLVLWTSDGQHSYLGGWQAYSGRRNHRNSSKDHDSRKIVRWSLIFCKAWIINSRITASLGRWGGLFDWIARASKLEVMGLACRNYLYLGYIPADECVPFNCFKVQNQLVLPHVMPVPLLIRGRWYGWFFRVPQSNVHWTTGYHAQYQGFNISVWFLKANARWFLDCWMWRHSKMKPWRKHNAEWSWLI